MTFGTRKAAAALLALAVGTVAPAAAADPDAYETGARLLARRDYPGAIAALTAAVAEQPRMTDGWLKLGMAHAAVLDWPPAERAYRKVLELEPRHKQALHNLGNVFFRQGRHEEAAVYYEKALDVDPDYLLAAFHHGWVLRQLNRPDEAEKAFTQAVQLTPRNDREKKIRVDSVYYLGALRFRAGDYATAAGYMEQVLQVSPGNAEARYYLGMAYRHLGRVAEAKEQLEMHRRMLREARRPDPVTKAPEQP